LDVLPLWLVPNAVALPIGDGLQHPHQGLHEVLMYFLLQNLVQKVTLEKSLQILIFRPYILHLFTKYYQNCFRGLGVKAILAVFYPKNCQVSIFFAKIPRARNTHSTNLYVLQLKKKIFLAPTECLFLISRKRLQKKVLFFNISPMASPTHSKNFSACNFYER
jgi:hypothetical protein